MVRHVRVTNAGLGERTPFSTKQSATGSVGGQCDLPKFCEEAYVSIWQSGLAGVWCGLTQFQKCCPLERLMLGQGCLRALFGERSISPESGCRMLWRGGGGNCSLKRTMR